MPEYTNQNQPSILRNVSSASTDPSTPRSHAPLFSNSMSYNNDTKSTPSRKWFPTRDISIARKVGAEFVGTFILIFCAAGGPIINQKYDGAETLIGNAACSGLAVMIIILSVGHISGAHLNPSVTLAFATLRHFPWYHVPAYIAAQVFGAIGASFALKGCFHPFLSGGVTVPSVSWGQAFALEFIATFILMFVITAVATDTRAVGELAGLAVGAAILLDVLITGPSTGASMNPVRTLGPAIATGNYKSIWIYIIAPTLGALAGGAVYTVIKLGEDDTTAPARSVRSIRRGESVNSLATAGPSSEFSSQFGG